MTKFFALAGLLAVLTFSTGCPSAYHDAVVAQHTAKSVVSAFQQAVIVEHTSGRISDEENRNLESLIEKLGNAGSTLNGALVTNASNTTVSVDLLGVIDAVAELENSGVLGIKNQTSREVLTASLGGIKATLQNVQTLINQKGKP